MQDINTDSCLCVCKHSNFKSQNKSSSDVLYNAMLVSFQTNSLIEEQNISQAQETSKQAKLYTLISIASGIVFIVLWITLTVVFPKDMAALYGVRIP